MIDPAQSIRTRLEPAAIHLPAETSAPAAAAEKGAVFGMQLEVMADPLEELMDSMEELAGQFEEKTMKEIGQRRLGEKRAKFSPVMRIMDKWLKMLPDMPQGMFLERIVKELKDRDARQLDSKTLIKKLASGSSDPTHIHAMLEVLDEVFAADKDNRAEILKLIREAKKELESEKGAEIRAGLNIAEEVNARGRTPAELRELRELYRDQVLGFEKPQDCFRSLLAERGIARLAESIDFLIRGAGADMQSAEPSMNAVKLRAVLLDLQSVEVLRTVLDGCGELLGRMRAEFAEHPLLSGEQLTGRVVDLTEMQFVSSVDIAKLLASCGFQQLLAKLCFTTSLTGLFRRLSPRLFADENGRQRMLDAAQEHLDGLISLEEEAEREQADKEAVA